MSFIENNERLKCFTFFNTSETLQYEKYKIIENTSMELEINKKLKLITHL